MIKKLLAIIEETIREARAKKTLIGFFVFSCLLIIIAFLIFQMSALKNNFNTLATDAMTQNGGKGPKNVNNLDFAGATLLEYIWAITSRFLAFVTVCIGIFATANLTTSMMEKGTIDLMLSKPVPRWMYITGRYLGASLIILIEVCFLIGGLWLAAAISFGTWGPQLLISIPYITLSFMGIYAVVVLIAVLSRSSALSIIVGITIYIMIGAVIPIGNWLDKAIGGGSGKGIFSVLADIVHWTLPQMNDLAGNMSDTIVGKEVFWAPILVTSLLVVAYTALSSWSFSRKEF
jgi:ABC-type transport system involved in multi-copper enzyme maturation permease subunit